MNAPIRPGDVVRFTPSEPPLSDAWSRRVDDRLIGALPPGAAALAVRLANERPELRPAIETVIAASAARAAREVREMVDTEEEGRRG